MHGYHPKEKHSYAALLSNQMDIPENVTAIPHMYNLMVRDALIAHGRNAPPVTPQLSPPVPLVQPDPAPAPAQAFAARVSVPVGQGQNLETQEAA
jgi:hypothetical protein